MQATTNFQSVGTLLSRPKSTKLWVSKKHLCKAATRLSDGNARVIKIRKQWAWRGDEVNVNSIPPADRLNYGIPDNERLLALVAAFKAEEVEASVQCSGYDSLEVQKAEVYHGMLDAKYNFHPYYNQIREKYAVNSDTCRLFAERWAVWEWITKHYNRTKNSLSIFHAAYERLFPGHLTEPNSFANFKKACDLKGIECKVVDQRAIVKAAKRISSFQETLLKGLYIQPQKITAAAAWLKLAEACEGTGEKTYSLSSVKNYFREFEKNAELFALRYGAGKAQKQMPHASLLPADHRNTQWQMDGWTLPFWGDKFQRYVLYLVRDNHSRKIAGYSIAPSENTALILEALEDAMSKTGVFPAEIVSDKHSFHKTEIAARLREETERMGAIWTVTTNAQRNQIAERYNQYLDELCKDFEGYTGKNITATGKDARPSAEAMEQTAKPANWKAEEEIRAIATYIVNKFNASKLDILEGQSPNEKYEASEDRKCFLLSDAERLGLLRPIQEYKVTRGQITIKVGIKKHEFQLPADLYRKYNNRLVKVVYEDLSQGIYISDTRTGEELGCIPPKRKIHGAIADQTEEDKKYLNELTGRKNGISTKARKEAQQRLYEALSENPEAIERIHSATMPKDIRQMAMQDTDLKRALAVQGVSVNKLPIRTPKAAALPIPEQKQGKSKNSPFAAPANHTMRKLTIEDIMGTNEQ